MDTGAPLHDSLTWAADLGISREAVELYRSADVVDLHLDTFIWTRLFGYDPLVRHGPGWLRGWFFSQADLPRLREARVAGATWVITTNPFRSAAGRTRALLANLNRLENLLGRAPGEVRIVRSAAEYAAARREGLHAAFIGLQGGNALGRPRDVDLLPERAILRVTLVHLTASRYGHPSGPPLLGRDRGLTAAGRELVERLEDRDVLVDLAHIGRKGFFDAVEAHRRDRPLLVTHTGVSGVHRHWRNLDDAQIRAIADSGGTIGIIFNSIYLGPKVRGTASWIVDHLEHVIRVAGEDHASLGSDFDGAIVPPRDLPSCLELPRLVQLMLDRGFGADRIRKILGGNFLRVVAAVRG
jgi:membrane dipeptidase